MNNNKKVTIQNATFELNKHTVEQLEKTIKEYHNSARFAAFDYDNCRVQEGHKDNWFNLEITPDNNVVFCIWNIQELENVHFNHNKTVNETINMFRTMANWLEGKQNENSNN